MTGKKKQTKIYIDLPNLDYDTNKELVEKFDKALLNRDLKVLKHVKNIKN